jgi:putative transposase
MERRLPACSTIERSMDEHLGWFSRGYLPHLDAGEITQFITFRLADSLPQSVLDELEYLKKSGSSTDLERYEKLEAFLDKGHGSCILRQGGSAKIVQEALLFLHGKRYELIAWVVMPNHVHFLARFGQGQSLSKALHSLKSFTANKLGKIHPDLRPIWQSESFDRYIRSEEHFARTIRYIHENPVKSNLCKMPESFRWSSAYVQSAD